MSPQDNEERAKTLEHFQVVETSKWDGVALFFINPGTRGSILSL